MTHRMPIPAPTPPRPWQFPHATEAVLANGVRVVSCRLPGVPFVHTEVVLDITPCDEPAGLDGLASVLASALAESIRLPDADRHSHGVVAMLGVTTAAVADVHSVRLRAGCSPDRLDVALRMLGEAVRRPLLDDGRCRRLVATHCHRSRRIGGLVERARDAQLSVLFEQPHRLGRPWSGTPATLSRISPADLLGLVAAHVRPSRATVVIAGDLASSLALALAEHAFGGWRPSDGPEPIRTRPAGPSPPSTRLVPVEVAGQGQVHLALVGVGPAPDAPDWPALLVGLHHLGGAQLSLLDLVLREQKGYTFSVRAGAEAMPGGAAVVVGGSMAEGQVAAAATELLAVVEKVRHEGLSGTDRDRAVSSLRDAAPRQLQTARAVATAYAEAVAVGLRYDRPAVLHRQLQAVSADDISRTIGRYLAPERLALVAAGTGDAVSRVQAALGRPG